MGREGGGWGGFSGRGGGLEALGAGVLLFDGGMGESENICMEVWKYGCMGV